jgi:hypothetical protein
LISEPTHADAVSLRLTSGVQQARCDNGAFTGAGGATGTCTQLEPGHVTFIGTVGGFSINVTTGITYPALGSADFPKFHLDSVNTGTGSLLIEASEVGYTGPASPANFRFFGSSTNSVGSSAFDAYLNDSNVLFATETLLGSGGPGGLFIFDEQGSATFLAPFSLTLRALINHATYGASSFNIELSAEVPEPGTATLFLLGLVGIMYSGWRRVAQLHA